jgi:ECF sigma factor.
MRRISAWQATTPSSPWDNRGHFFAAAAEAMRRILVEKARRKGECGMAAGPDEWTYST